MRQIIGKSGSVTEANDGNVLLRLLSAEPSIFRFEERGRSRINSRFTPANGSLNNGSRGTPDYPKSLIVIFD